MPRPPVTIRSIVAVCFYAAATSFVFFILVPLCMGHSERRAPSAEEWAKLTSVHASAQADPDFPH